MLELDLHGVRHADVKDVVINFLYDKDMPVRIITGNSNSMKNIVKEVLDQFNLEAMYESPNNLGALLIVDK